MNAKQNAQVEKLAKDAAAANRPADWRQTPIFETAAAKETDPFRRGGFFNDEWWKKTEPRYHDGTKVWPDAKGMKIVNNLVTRYAHDGAIGEDTPTPVAPAFAKYLPEPNEVLKDWLPKFAEKVNVVGNPWFSVLRSYVEKSPRGSRLSDVNQKTVRTLVQLLW
jgi:hypothetical protein